jgi:PEP-CTERM motif
MKKSLLVVLIAIALPLAARADGVNIGFGSLSYTPGPTVDVTSFVAFAYFPVCTAGVCTTGQGLVIDQGGSLSLVSGTNGNGPVIFQGVFTSVNVIKNDVNGLFELQITAVIKGHFVSGFKYPYPGIAYLTLETRPIAFPFCDTDGGKTSCTVSVDGGFLDLTASPEPGTLGLLGTGILGIAAVVRKKILAG